MGDVGENGTYPINNGEFRISVKDGVVVTVLGNEGNSIYNLKRSREKRLEIGVFLW